MIHRYHRFLSRSLPPAHHPTFPPRRRRRLGCRAKAARDAARQSARTAAAGLARQHGHGDCDGDAASWPILLRTLGLRLRMRLRLQQTSWCCRVALHLGCGEGETRHTPKPPGLPWPRSAAMPCAARPTARQPPWPSRSSASLNFIDDEGRCGPHGTGTPACHPSMCLNSPHTKFAARPAEFDCFSPSKPARLCSRHRRPCPSPSFRRHGGNGFITSSPPLGAGPHPYFSTSLPVTASSWTPSRRARARGMP